MAKYGISRYGQTLYGIVGGAGEGVLSPIYHRFNIARAYITFAGFNNASGLQVTHSRNQFDELGDMVSLRRLHGEDNSSYRRRIQDAMVHYANASYQGMVYGITRELGLSIYDSITINPRVDGNGKFLAPDPYIRFEGPYVYLYSDYTNNMLDWAIDRFEAGGNYEHLGRLVEMINNTSFFEATLPENIDYFTRSMTILNQSNRRVVTFERVKASTVFALDHERIVPGSLFFSNRDVFRTEMDSIDDVLVPGQYYVDYHSGIIKVFTIPTISDIVRYQYVEYPFTVVASPIIIHDVTNENFRVKMFEQVLLDDGTVAHGLPTELGVDIINELLSVVPMYWGL